MRLLLMRTPFAKHLVPVLLSATLIAIAGCKRSPAVPVSAPQNALAEVLGEEVAQLAGPGAKVLVLAPASGDAAAVWVDPVLKSFSTALAQQGKGTVVATEKVKARLDDPSPMREELTAAQFEGFLRGVKNATVIVSFVGFPVLDAAQIAGLKDRKVKLIAIYTVGPQAGPHYKKLLEARVLDLAILPRMDPPAGAAQPPVTPRDFVNRQYLLVTPETAAKTQF